MDSTFVNQIMSKTVLTADKDTTLQEAAQEMKKLSVGCVIVTENYKPVGIVTERDFVTKVVAEGRPLFTKVFDIMSEPLITIDSKETVWEAAEIMRKNSIHKLPVMEEEEIVGIITTSDIVKISSAGSDSQMRKICDQILMRMKDE